MIEIIIGVVIRFVTELQRLTKKATGKGVSPRYIVGILCLIAGFVYYGLNASRPEVVQEMGKFIAGAFAVSQGLFLIASKKVLSEDKE